MLSDEDIKEKIRSHFQVDLDNLANTDILYETVEMDDEDEGTSEGPIDGGPNYDRANELLAKQPRIEIVWE